MIVQVLQFISGVFNSIFSMLRTTVIIETNNFDVTVLELVFFYFTLDIVAHAIIMSMNMTPSIGIKTGNVVGKSAIRYADSEAHKINVKRAKELHRKPKHPLL